ncbi:hypothetical protein CAPTEDRAFT_205049 [Capitella teleta]|uniref:EF-hand domain-containing protein n=1 Tax=Capitella teleta TaxID=283909 RepID=R7TFF3_CAPTE|nr:hypothetical protein CAPTEDRAFT_205049 [Capitella teleta]|eukprot:ELT90271.1 hypothetical protein CAPTEDRAFT_205049 [Capitella teleta]
MATAYKDWGVIFKRADKDKNGVIDFGELKEALGNYGYRESEAKIKELFHKEEEEDENIRVSRIEFTKIMNSLSDETHVSILIRKSMSNKSNQSPAQLEAVIDELNCIMAPEVEIDRLKKVLKENRAITDANSFVDAYLNCK